MQLPQFNFNANHYDPNQGMSSHPPAQKIPFQITNTSITENKEKTGAYLAVDLTSSQGTVIMRYNIYNQNPKAVDIAYGQLSALCRAVGVYQIDGNNECAALRGAKGLMDVGYQKDEEPNPQFPDRKGYTELKKVYDINGNDPSKPAQAQQGGGGFGGQPQHQPPQQSQPLQQQPGGNWGASPPQGQNPNQQPPQAQQQPPQQGGGAWQPSGGQQGGNGAPPWGNR